MSRIAAGRTMIRESKMTLANSEEMMPVPNTRNSPSPALTTRSVSTWIDCSGLVPLVPTPLATPVGISWVITVIVAPAEASWRLKSLLSEPAKPGAPAARFTAASISPGVARSIARSCASTLSAVGSSCLATCWAELRVALTRNPVRSSTRSWAASMSSIAPFESTLRSDWMTWVVPVSGAKGCPNSRSMSWRASSEAVPSENWLVPVSVVMPPSPVAMTMVTSRNTATTRTGLSATSSEIRSTVRSWSTISYCRRE